MNSQQSFEKYFHQNILPSNGNKKVTIILGSGFHKQAFENKNNLLNDWTTLLKSVDRKVKITDDYVLDFESIVCAHTGAQKKKPAYLIEKEILKSISTNLKEFNFSKAKEKYPIGIFKNKFVHASHCNTYFS